MRFFLLALAVVGATLGGCGPGRSTGAGDAGADLPGAIGPNGGALDTLAFAIVGDTRPALIDDTAYYPTAVIQRIWTAVEAEAPHLPFAVTTGDYVYASPWGNEGASQLDLYLGTRAAYSGLVFYAMGNHECTWATASNCGAGTADGLTNTYVAFLSKMLAPLGKTQPYYAIRFDSASGAATPWTAKFVFVAPNAWTPEQASWLESALSEPSTYTFVVRHEHVRATTAPGVLPSADILARHPYTLLVAGHSHTFAYYPADREVIVGNGGAPLGSTVNFGYAVVRQRPDGAIEVTGYDYMSHAVLDSFGVWADGTRAF